MTPAARRLADHGVPEFGAASEQRVSVGLASDLIPPLQTRTRSSAWSPLARGRNLMLDPAVLIGCAAFILYFVLEQLH